MSSFGPLRVGIVGSGIGRAHAEAYLQLPEMFQVAAICDVDTPRAAALAALCGPHTAVLAGLQDLCAAPDLDVVDICTPPWLHYPHALQALAAGKHVICEKPVAGSLAEVDDLLAAEARTGRRVMPIFQNRFGGGVQKLKLLIDAGLAGRHYLTTLETHWRRRPVYYAVPWRGRWQTELGGPLLSLAIHAVDVALYLLGPPRSAFARAATLVNPIDTEDCLAATVELADGSLLALSVTTGSAQEISRLRACFANLVAESNTQPYANTSDPWTYVVDALELEAAIAEKLGHFIPAREGFAGQFERYYRALAGGRELPVTLREARGTLELITAIYASLAARQPAALPIAPDHPMYAGWQPGRGAQEVRRG